MEYYAVHRTGESSDELRHWKYIKKIKKNGKWRYFYDQAEVDKYKKNTVQLQSGPLKPGEVRNRTVYSDSETLLGSTVETVATYSGGPKNKTTSKITYVNRGKIQKALDTAVAKTERTIYDNFLKDSSKVQRAARKVSSILSRFSRK